MSILILHDSDTNKISSKYMSAIHNATKDVQRYRYKNIYLFKPEHIKLIMKIYNKILDKNKDTKTLSVLIVENNYEIAKKIYRDILISWFS